MQDDIDFGDEEQPQEEAPSVVEAVEKPAPKKAPRGRPRKGVPQKKSILKVKKTIAKKGGKSTKGPGGVKRPHRWKQGTVALREIRRYQKGTDLQFQKAPFQRLVRELLAEVQGGSLNDSSIGRVSGEAMMALQEAAEAFTVELFQVTNTATVSAKRSTILPRDMDQVRRVQMRGLPVKY